jgi:hypothetical protein
MDKKDYLMLEELLGKLRAEIGNRYCIIPDHVQDGFCIAVYDNNKGNLLGHYSSYDLKSTVEKIQNTYKEFDLFKG